jgi:putative heme-binding domain-containing protein
MPNSSFRSLSLAVLLPLALPLRAEEAPARTEADILKSVKLPEGYEATVFAMPPQIGYPTSVSAAVDGTIFVAVDENGSIDAKPGRGRVVRLRDTDGDGKADEIKVFAEMDSPRGVIWDGPSGNGPGTLYVMHPPNLTAYTDTDGDGKADKQEDIVTGLGFDLKFRGADHTTNGCRLAIDGFIYVAVGDYGFINARAKDGTTLTNRGGGIVRVRPDGTGFEIVSRGQRNIYDVAVSPTLDLFTRDNTNDGGGWDVRLSFVPPGAHMGYPYYFVNFPEDHLQPLADYGGGSPCGALWIDEPGLQNGLYTVEWGRNAIMYHTLKQKGAGWEVDGPKKGETEWLKLTRPTDMDVDASGAIYITSWDGATFTYNGPNAGYVLRVTKKDKLKVAVPDLAKESLEELYARLGGKSAATRVAAQREMLRRAQSDENAVWWHPATGFALFANTPPDETAPAEIRIADINFLGQRARITNSWFGEDTHGALKSEATREAALRAIGDIARPSGKNIDPATAPVTDAAAWATEIVSVHLLDKNPRVRAVAITALRRLGKTDAAPNILPLVADADPVISHLAVRALSEFKAAQVCLGALDSADEKMKPGALRALYGIYDMAVVDGLIARLQNAQGELRKGIVNALCRLSSKDAEYIDPKVWWGTRPDTSGPVYKPEKWEGSDKIEAVLRKELDVAKGPEAFALVQLMYKTKVNFPNLSALMLEKAGSDGAAKIAALETITGTNPGLNDDAMKTLQGVAADENVSPEVRAKALRLFQRAAEWPREVAGALVVLAPLAGHDLGQPALTAAFEDYTHDPKLARHANDLEKIAAGPDAAKRTLAQTILVNMATSNLVKGKEHDATAAAVEKSWGKPESAASLLGVIARTKAKAYAEQVRAHLKDPNNAVAEAALFAYQALGLKDTGVPMTQIAAMKYEDVFVAVQKGGDAAQGKEMFLRAGCIACHTASADEPPKGPILSAAAKIYDRAALTESILKPNAKIAQGFESVWVKTRKGEQVEGFVTREGGDSLDIRNVVGQVVTMEKGDIAERGKRETSIMPEGLLNAFAPADLANLLAYLESLKAAK